MDDMVMGRNTMRMPPKSPMTGTVPDTTYRPRLDEMKTEMLVSKAIGKTIETMGNQYDQG